jgi:hypothetical protein
MSIRWKHYLSLRKLCRKRSARRSLRLCLDGATLLSDVRVPVLTVVCEPCGRRERYDVERRMRQYGWDAKLTDLLAGLTADCPKRGSVSVYDRCKAVYETRDEVVA